MIEAFLGKQIIVTCLDRENTILRGRLISAQPKSICLDPVTSIRTIESETNQLSFELVEQFVFPIQIATQHIESIEHSECSELPIKNEVKENKIKHTLQSVLPCLLQGPSQKTGSLNCRLQEFLGQKVAVLCSRYCYRGVLTTFLKDGIVLANASNVKRSGKSLQSVPVTERPLGGSIVIMSHAIELIFRPRWAGAPLFGESNYASTGHYTAGSSLAFPWSTAHGYYSRIL